ncbi:hypothetical protein ACTOB_000564 [Actinoplanes oblitus]|uniref:Serine/threonine protein kinase n=1 Tax=Actinoplanes oblitus TaxID=3040509 RepID=A0ABY8WHC5_9ACTN|nr:hypothetical protein [Actinoplanes oblitus]WIM97073.1 hypothetical protein ACTOB_000564 [Actinoplanes oblitus]
MTDQLERLFADLRAETTPRITPPGTAAARSTVRRRRIRRTAIAGAGLAVAVVAAGAGFGFLSPFRPSPPAEQPATLSPQARDSLARVAAQQIGLHDGDLYGGTINGSEPGRAVTLDRVPGEYELIAACAGQEGTVGLDVSGTHLSLPCGAKPGPVHATVTVPATEHQVTLEATPDAAARDRVGVAYSMALTQDAKDALVFTAYQRIGGSPEFGGNQAFVYSDVTMQEDRIDAGRYRFTVACAGAGSIRIELGNQQLMAAGPIATYQRKCDGKVGGYEITMPAGTTEATILVTPSKGAENQAGVAWRWDPL